MQGATGSKRVRMGIGAVTALLGSLLRTFDRVLLFPLRASLDSGRVVLSHEGVWSTRACRPAARWNHGRFRPVGAVCSMARNAVLDLPLTEVMRSEIALTLKHVLNIYTVGGLLRAWRSPRNHKSIEQVFDTPQQARV